MLLFVEARIASRASTRPHYPPSNSQRTPPPGACYGKLMGTSLSSLDGFANTIFISAEWCSWSRVVSDSTVWSRSRHEGNLNADVSLSDVVRSQPSPLDTLYTINTGAMTCPSMISAFPAATGMKKRPYLDVAERDEEDELPGAVQRVRNDERERPRGVERRRLDEHRCGARIRRRPRICASCTHITRVFSGRTRRVSCVAGMRLTERVFRAAFELEQTHGDARCGEDVERDGEGKERHGGLFRKVRIECCVGAEDRNQITRDACGKKTGVRRAQVKAGMGNGAHRSCRRR